MSSSLQIAEYIERNQYEALVDMVLHGYGDLTNKDKKDVYRYLARVNGLHSIDKKKLFHLRLACEDYSQLTALINDKFYQWKHNEKTSCFQTILERMDYKKIEEILPDSFFLDREFFQTALQLWERFPEHFKSKFTQVFDIHKVPYDERLNDIFCLYLNTIIPHYPSELEPFINQAKTNIETWSWLESKIRQHLSLPFRMTQFSTLAFFAQHFNLNQVIPERMKRYCFQNYYSIDNSNEEDKLASIYHFMKTGYKKITTLFNQALVYRDIPLIKMMLPFKPRMVTALKFVEKLSDTSDDIVLKDLIVNAIQKSGKKKVSGADNPEKTNEDLD